MVNLLDHGYLRVVETWGSDERIIEAARMSTDKGFQGWGPIPCVECKGAGHYIEDDLGHDIQCRRCKGTGQAEGDTKLLRYLYTNKHMTPFEMAGAVIEVQAPLMVFREWHRHRTQSYNELSARYTELPDLFYIPSQLRLQAGAQSTTNRQSGDQRLDPRVAERAALEIHRASAYARESYRRLLDAGVARELARLVIPVNQYSRMRASANLRNWLQFLELRMASGAQWEIRQYAEALCQELQDKFPRTLNLFNGD